MNNVDVNPTKSSSAWKIFAVFYLIAVGGVAALLYQRQTSACQQSRRLIAILQFAPYELRAEQLASIIPTVNYEGDVAAEFFETDWRVTNRFSLKLSDGVISGTICCGLAPVLQVFKRCCVLFTGDTNWLAYRIVLNQPSSYDETCLMELNEFNFK